MLTRSWRSSSALMLLAVILVTAACGQQAPAPSGTPGGAAAAGGQPAAGAPSGGAQRLVVAVGGLPKSLDFNSDTSLLSTAVFRLYHDALVQVDEKGTPRPALAESWSTPDPTTWQFSLRKGVTFSNGEPFNAEAAKFTLQRIIDPAAKSQYAQRLAFVDAIEAPDESTLTIRTKGPSAVVLANLSLAQMQPPKYFQEKGEAEYARAPIGTGPYVVKEWRPDDYVTLEANPTYWGPAPKVPRLHVRAVPEESTRVAGLESGEIDIAVAVPPEQVERLKGRGLQIVTTNIGHGMTISVRTLLGGPLGDKRVRQALNYAVDKDAIVNQILAGQARVLDGQIVGPNAFGYNPNLKPYPYDPARAKELLTEAGVPNGLSTKLQCSNGRWLKDKEVCEAVVGQLAQVGVTVELELVESTVWWDLYSNGRISQLFDNAWLYAPAMDAELAVVNFQTESPRKLMSSPAFDEAYKKQVTTVDPQERLTALHGLLEVMRDEAPMIFLYQVPGIFGLGKKVQSAQFRADYSIDPSQIITQ